MTGSGRSGQKFGHAQAPFFKAPSRRLQTKSAPRLEAVLTLFPRTAVNATSVFVGEQQSDESRRMNQTLSESNSLSRRVRAAKIDRHEQDALVG